MRYLELIATGTKTIDVRVAYPQNQAIRAGQRLTFVSGTRRVTTRVRQVRAYPSFAALAAAEDAAAIGCASSAELLAALNAIYGAEQERLGVLAIEIELTPVENV
jgi:ASC-1-like (ASCH) protein